MASSAAVRERLKQARRIVVKLGTHVVTRDGHELALGRVATIVESLVALQREGRQVILISSGSIALGAEALGLKRRPTSLGQRQACAAVGQGKLMSLYNDALGHFGVHAAQVLLTQEDLADPDRLLCLRTTLFRSLELGVIPILNENDSVSVREIIEHRGNPGEQAEAFGDNDGLSARVALALGADALLLLSNVDGVYREDPRQNPNAERIRELSEIDDAMLRECSSTSSGGTGGMASKLEAARLASEGGVDVLIADGTRAEVLTSALAGDEIGTWIPTQEPKTGKRREIQVTPDCKGAFVINDGAKAAIVKKKASLLPVGVVEVEGHFQRGDVVELRDASGCVLGRGMVNYDAQDCRKLAGRHSDDITDILGWKGYDALVTRDNMSVGEV